MPRSAFGTNCVLSACCKMTHLAFSPTDRQRLSALEEVRRDNFSILRAYSLLLNAAPDCITAEEMTAMTGDLSSLPESTANQMRAYAVYGLLCAKLSFDPEATDKNRAFAKRYLLPSLSALSPALVEDDPYLRAIPARHIAEDGWEYTTERYAPYELFARDEAVRDKSLREIPQIGFFPRAVSYPAVLQAGREWMTVTPNEIATMRAPIAAARGRVVTFGLGLGYFAFMAARRPEVTEVTVVERDPTVIRLFERHLLPHFPEGGKLRLICEDAFAFAQSEAIKAYDLVFSDIWHDPSDGIVPYLCLRSLSRRAAGVEHHYWLEDTLLSHLRWRVFRRVAEEAGILPKQEEDETADRLLATAAPKDYADVLHLLSNQGLISAISKENFT